MKSLSPAQLAYRQSRTGVSCHGLLWITAKNRDTGAAESLGLWTGDDHQVFSINSQGRTYFAAGSLLDIEDIVAEVGVQVRQATVTLSGVSNETLVAIKSYDARLAPVEIHRAEFDTETNQLIEEPMRVWKGWIDKITEVISPEDENGVSTATVTLTLVSSARALTRTRSQKFSDASQRLRDPSDGFFKYADVTGADIWWGSQRGTSPTVAGRVVAAFRGKLVSG